MLEVLSKDNLLCLIENFSNEVKKNYELNRYNEVYRNDKLITDFEQYCIDYFLELLGSAPHILDLGCGAAKTYDKYMVKCGCHLTGVDFSEKQISLARKNCPKGKFLCMDMLQYNFSDKFDGVVMFYSLFHIYRDYHSLILKRIYNSLYAKGKVLLNIRKEDSGNIKEKKDFCGFPMYWSNFSSSHFFNLARKVGFEICVLGDEKEYGSKESHLWVILSKH